ncbi:ArsR/SmtB family transcription factor [Poriferisphaera corsica]|uniref:ArsR/SmtB family transcription factor n=1 Tax=Poriferisphaera corsica TaxID=2528020 RepID=UPI0011A71B16
MDRSIQIKAIASKPRMQILKLLAKPRRHFKHQWSADPVNFGVCMTLIAEALDIAQPTASRHLDILKQAGFITVRKHQKWSYCKRHDKNIQAFTTWLSKQLAS